jgi:hypothetical protein
LHHVHSVWTDVLFQEGISDDQRDSICTYVNGMTAFALRF